MKWFNIHKSGVEPNEYIISSQLRIMNEKEKSFFEFDANYLENPITIGNRLKIKNKIYESTLYKRIGKKYCNFAISYKNENLTNFGKILYFLKINENIYVAINDFKIINYSLGGIQGRLSNEMQSLKNSGIFNNLFFEVEIINETIFIRSDQIKSFCFLSKTYNTYFISEYINEHEHD